MGISQKVGNFSLNTVTGLQSVTGIGFTPKVVLFINTVTIADGVSDNYLLGLGAGVSSTNRFDGAFTDKDAQVTMDTSRSIRNNFCADMNNPGEQTTDYKVDLETLDADGFTVDITNAPSVASRLGFWAIGGDDLTDVTTDNFVGNGAAGNQTVTGIGFKPDAVLFFNTRQSPLTGDTNGAIMSIGMAISSTERAYVTNTMQDALATSQTTREQDTDACIHLSNEDGTQLDKADFVSMDADGFTINWTTGNIQRFFFVAFKGGQYKIGNFQAKTSTGNFSETGVGFTPGGGLFASWGRTANVNNQSPAFLSLGFASDTTERFVAGGNSEDGVGTSNSNQWSDDGKLYQIYNFTPGLRGDIDFVSWDADGMTLNQTDAETSLVQVLYFLIGSAADDLLGTQNINIAENSIQIYNGE